MLKIMKRKLKMKAVNNKKLQNLIRKNTKKTQVKKKVYQINHKYLLQRNNRAKKLNQWFRWRYLKTEKGLLNLNRVLNKKLG